MIRTCSTLAKQSYFLLRLQISFFFFLSSNAATIHLHVNKHQPSHCCHGAQWRGGIRQTVTQTESDFRDNELYSDGTDGKKSVGHSLNSIFISQSVGAMRFSTSSLYEYMG